MRVVTWNCNGGFRNKYHLLDSFNADLFVIQECENPTKYPDSKYFNWANRFYWIGENNSKGLGVFIKNNIDSRLLDWKDDNLKYFIPIRINDTTNLIAVWCHQANSPTFEYIGQFWKYMQMHKYKFGQCIVLGDFNSNAIWDKWDRWWNFSDVVRELKDLDIYSLYHQNSLEIFGKESTKTFFLHKNLEKGYHIDYVFMSRDYMKLLREITFEKPENWISISDHMPIFIDVLI